MLGTPAHKPCNYKDTSVLRCIHIYVYIHPLCIINLQNPEFLENNLNVARASFQMFKSVWQEITVLVHVRCIVP